MKNRYIISNTCERKLSNYIDIGGAENEKNISTKIETKYKRAWFYEKNEHKSWKKCNKS